MIAIQELNNGDTLPSVVLKPVSRLDLIQYAGASGDFNPIHTIDNEAKRLGLPGVIAHGMWTMGNMTKLFTPFYEEGFVKHFRNRFSGMVFLDDVLNLSATLNERREDELHFTVEAIKQDGQTVSRGYIIFCLYKD
jgi:acyl dehydratase